MTHRKLLKVCTILLAAAWAAYALFLLFRVWPANVVTLSNSGLFGDSFGVFSSLFSGLALIGLLYTILQQGDELRLQREEMSKNVAAQIRQLHFSLLQIAMNDSSGELEKVWSLEDVEQQTFKQGAYTNLIMSHWEMQFAHGILSRGQVEIALGTYMKYPHFKIFWERSREHRSKMAKATGDATDSAEVFHQLAEAAYNKALEPTAPPSGGATA